MSWAITLYKIPTCTSGWAEVSWNCSLCLQVDAVQGSSEGVSPLVCVGNWWFLARLSAISCPFKTHGKLNNMTCWEGGQLLVRHLYFCCLSCCYKFLTLAFHFWYFSLGQIKDGFVTSGSLQMRQLQAMKYAPAFKGRTGNLLLGIGDGEGFREHDQGFCLPSALAASMCMCKTTKPASCVPGG